ncbi:DnaA ATPase domain-containing protein [Muricauda sp. MAR_2010_75]|uniref:DnaA ATPase domain-containing protein n=1 Tax=Allomuricauda sp. MAR_2010_75 TaxID=1250232 RepID=UPI00056A72BC|nr:DnaA/Hda family protein [Muricauda sp. MAR_2010_75]
MSFIPKTPQDAIRNLTQKKANADGLSDNQVKAVHGVYSKYPEMSKKQAISIDFYGLFEKHSRLLEPKYQVNKIIKTLAWYFMGDPNFDRYNLVTNESKASLKKGLFIYGPVGVGKTMFFDVLTNINKELFEEYERHAFGFTKISAPGFVNEFMHSAKGRNKTVVDLEYYQRNKLYIDDLGAEHKCFNQFELFGDILFERHRNKAITYVTTNLHPTEIEERYGERIGDRLIEMFNVIRWDGDSLRH